MRDVNATIVIDLKNKNEEEIWRDIKYTRRKYIKQAGKFGLTHTKSDSEKSQREMYYMNMQTFLEGGIPAWTYEKWKNLVKTAGENFFFVVKGGKRIGCFVLTEINDRFYDPSSKGNRRGIRPLVFASKKEFNQFRPNDYIYWSTIKHALDNGYDFVDLGGWQINPRGHVKNINRFKEEWGGQIKYYYWDYPFFTAVRRKLIRNSSIFWHINNFVKNSSGKRKNSVHDSYVGNAAARN